jgi:ribonucleoside-diphosphate reductase beta chain
LLDKRRTTITIFDKSESFVIRYPEAEAFTKKQLSVFWLADEIKVEKDVHDILTNLTEAEKHGVLTVLRLFSLYELYAGRDYWTGRIMELFPRPEIQRMASVFGMFELAVHQPFYSKIDESLGQHTDEFYLGYVDDPVLKQRMDFIQQYEDTDYFLPMFSMLEGAVLYSSFAFLKHFQSQGKNKLTNIVRGINFSVRDENLHHEAGAWLWREYWNAVPVKAGLEPEEVIHNIALELFEHERAIIAKIFEMGKIVGITAHQLEEFVKSRINICLKNLGFNKLYEITYNPIADWFYDGINNYTYNDFFAGQGREYSRGWNEKAFAW